MTILKLKNQEQVGMRLDKFLSLELKEYSRSHIQTFIKKGRILVNDKPSKSSYPLLLKDVIKFNILEIKQDSNLKEENTELTIIHEEKDFFVIDKPYGVVVHPSETGYRTGTVVNSILEKIDKKYRKDAEDLRPGIVHRLDKDTSGLLIIAKNKKSHDYFVEQFKLHKIKKYYLTLVYGIFEHKEGIIDSPIGRDIMNRKRMSVVASRDGKEALTVYKVLKEYNIDKNTHLSLIEIELKTGRTHQIRVHMKAVNHPVILDKVYGIRSFNEKFTKLYGLKRQFLHACKMIFLSPTSKKIITVESKLPNDLDSVLKELK
ncbi:MAG TPA: RluA family pseudouridine synthase [Candidatus Portnoybacteria bacterium]|nr:RluA family pseudouridine synthase [Candidatus Portnoybacteria bacterium]